MLKSSVCQHERLRASAVVLVEKAARWTLRTKNCKHLSNYALLCLKEPNQFLVVSIVKHLNAKCGEAPYINWLIRAIRYRDGTCL